MARAKFTLPDEMLSKLSKLGSDIDAIAEDVVYEGAVVAEKVLKETLKSTIGKGIEYKGRSTGELVENIGIETYGINTAIVGFNYKSRYAGFRKSKRKKHKKSSPILQGAARHYDVAYMLEHGRSNFAARPFMKRARRLAKGEVKHTMAEHFKRMTSKYT